MILVTQAGLRSEPKSTHRDTGSEGIEPPSLRRGSDLRAPGWHHGAAIYGHLVGSSRSAPCKAPVSPLKALYKGLMGPSNVRVNVYRSQARLSHDGRGENVYANVRDDRGPAIR
ncbi:hypothetical protein LCGC14_0554920 [marine sediment metagenome]|uniref:Uncharacterized protein n=1 Tax=marine sediment metagenome TaxID=412755 RepID=A0A0F9S7B1_9ZZZZ